MSRPGRSCGLLAALALVCLLAATAPAALAREHVRPPRELVRQYPLDAGGTRLKSGEDRAQRQLAAAGAASPAAAARPDADGGGKLPGFLLIGLGVSALAAGAVFVARAPSSAPELAATPAAAAPLRAASPAAASPRRRRRGAVNGSSPTRGGGSVKDQPALQQRIADMRKSGMTLQAIADTLNGEGIPTVRGGARWRPSSVQTAAGYKRPGTGGNRPARPASAR